jgi:Undecaprenyl-phosphate galactose phosphotransferase WbaP
MGPALLLLSDMVALCLSIFLSVWLYLGQAGWAYARLWPLLFFFPLTYAILGLYPGMGLHPAEEIRLTTYATTAVFVVLATATFLFKVGPIYSRGVFLLAWGFGLILMNLSRPLARRIFSRKSWWGYPVVILGAGETGRLIVRTLLSHPGLGLRPTALLDDDPAKWGSYEGVPILGGIDRAVEIAEEGVRHAILAMPGVPRARLLEILDKDVDRFPHLMLMPDLFGFSTLWIRPRDMVGILGLEVRQSLLLPGSRLEKRLLDLVVACLGGLLLPFMAVIALLIKLDSLGPVFYSQTRLGRGGSVFGAIKFRTMCEEGETRLHEILAASPELQAEYEIYHKLRDDPRLTRFGRLLRRFSLDELPQLINVLKGEMSLVGPRAYLPRELSQMNGKEKTILKVVPGITGVCQISGRNQTTFEDRLRLDEYYIRNWSIWLDLYVLSRTVEVVLRGRGAY